MHDVESVGANPLSDDLRLRAARALERGEETLAEISARLEISISSLTRFRAKLRQGQTLEPLPHSGGRPLQKLFDGHFQALEGWLKEKPDLTNKELAQKLLQEYALTIHPSQLSRVLKNMGLTRKKKVGWIRVEPAPKPVPDDGCSKK